MKFDPAGMEAQSVYKLMAGLIVPRPIAFTSTLSRDGLHNVAPFSFFMMITSSPPHVAISVGARNGESKDTLENIRHTGDFVINTVNEEIGQQMAITAAEWPSDVSEFEQAGLTPIPSDVVQPMRVAEAPANLECQVRQIVPVGDLPYGAHLVIAEVVRIHIKDDLVLEGGRIDLQGLQALGRLTGDWYCSTNNQYELKRPAI